MSNSLTEDYLRWLEPQIRDNHSNPEKTYRDLLKLMFAKEFVWLVANDDNRRADGLDLRLEFCHKWHIPTENTGDFLTKDSPSPPCSILEVLIGLARRLAFLAGGEVQGWAWQLLSNLELHKMSDPLSPRKSKQVDDILDTCVWRTYRPDGQGGFFPLAWPEEDQTKIELWYQMAAFINELHPEH